MGRRKDCYTDAQKLQVMQIVCEKIANSDLPLADICAMAKDVLPGSSTIRWWCTQSADLLALYSRAMIHRADYLAEQVISLADNAVDHVKARNQIIARQWATARLNPAKYSDKLNIDLNATVTVQDDPASLKSALAMYHILQRLQGKAVASGEVIELPRLGLPNTPTEP